VSGDQHIVAFAMQVVIGVLTGAVQTWDPATGQFITEELRA